MAAAKKEGLFASVSPQLIRPWREGRFAVYLKQNNKHVLYTNKGQDYTAESRNRLMARGVEEVYIPMGDMKEFEYYLQENIGEILKDDLISFSVRAGAWYRIARQAMKYVFEHKLTKPLYRAKHAQLEQMVRSGVEFFNVKGTVEHVVPLIAEGENLYEHSIGLMVLVAYVLRTIQGMDTEMQVQCCTGCLLHDAGRVKLPAEVQESDPRKLKGDDAEAFKNHPYLTLELCENLSLTDVTRNTILLHHEMISGRGFPQRLKGDDLPIYVRAVSLCNVYDRLTRETPYRSARTPKDALKEIQNYPEDFDQEMLKRLTYVIARSQSTAASSPAASV